MSGTDKYLTLITSLPHIGGLFQAAQPPLSRVRLKARLAMLDAEDAAVVQEIDALLGWINHPMEKSDAEIVAHAHTLLERLHTPLLRELVGFRLEVRTLVAALRRRGRGEGPPARREPWGYGRWLAQIQRYWREPGFRLEGMFPWLGEANRLLGEGDALGLERLLLRVIWEHLERARSGHDFDLEAVVIYVLRWDIIDRCTRYGAAPAEQRFTALIDRGLGEYDRLFAA